MTASALVRIDDASFTYPGEGVVALRAISTSIEAGTVVGVVGRNGSGKTTLAKLLNGLLRPTSGSVIVEDRDTRRHSVAAMAALVGYAFQDPNHQLFARTVADELAFGPRNLGWPPAAVDARVAEVAADFGIEAHLATHPYRLTRPDRKVVAIASVVAMRPRVLVLDEPTTGQDHRTAAAIADHIVRLRRAGTTVVCVAHDLSLVATVADRVLVLAEGRLIADAPPRAVLADTALLAATDLVAPPIARLSAALPGRPGRGVALTVDELVVAMGRTSTVGRVADGEGTA